MQDKKFHGAPFGTQKSRFDVSGVHPKCKHPGTYTQIPYDSKFMDETARGVGPGSYFINDGGFNNAAVMARASGPGWARAYEVERMASQPHLLFRDEWEARRLLKETMGPGKYNVPEFLQTGFIKNCPSRGICDTLADRFAEVHQQSVPGPGTYGSGGIADAVYQEKQQEAPSKIGMLDSGGATGFDPSRNNKYPGPGAYSYSSFTDKHAIVPGPTPFELYSYDRTKPITTGHLAILKNANLAPGQYNISSTIDSWTHQDKKKHGKFSKMVRFPAWPSDRHSLVAIAHCPKPKSQPGPSYYDPMYFPKKETSPNAPPFLSSSLRKGLAKPGNTVGAGRYDIQRFDDSIHMNGHSSAFKSKSSVRPNLAMTKQIRERLRMKNARPEDREFAVTPPVPGDKHMVMCDWAAKRAVTVV